MPNRVQRSDKWSSAFQKIVEQNLSNSLVWVVENQETPDKFHPHFDSIISQVQWGFDCCPELSAHLLLSMHPWPARWALLDTWCYQLEAAIKNKNISIPIRRRVLACLTDVYMIAGLSCRVLDISKELFQLGPEELEEYAKLITFSGGAWISAMISQGKLSQAESTLDEMEQRLLSLNFDELQIQNAAAVLALQKAILLRHNNRLFEALEILTKVINANSHHNLLNRSLFFELLETRAVFYRAWGDYDAALMDLGELQNNYISTNERLAESSLHGNRGLVYWSMARYDEAEKELLSAIEITEKCKAYPLLSRQLGPLSLIYLAKGEIEKALLFVERQIEIASAINNTSEQNLARANRACMLIYAQRADEALPDLLSSLEEMLVQGQKELTISAHLDLAICYYMLDDKHNSEHHAQQAYEISLQSKNAISQMLAMRTLALTQNESEAIALIDQSLSLAERHGRALDEASCLLYLSQIVSNVDLKKDYRDRATLILKRIGATKWLDTDGDQVKILPLLL